MLKVLLVFVFAGLSFVSNAATRTWTGLTSNAWATNTNWVGNNIPVAGDAVVIGDASFTGAFQPIYSSNTSISYASINIGSTKASVVTFSGTATVTITGLLTINSTSSVIFSNTTATSKLAGNLTTAGTGLLQIASTNAAPITSGRSWSFEVELNGGTQSVVAGTYTDLTISGSGTTAAVGNISVSGALTVAPGVTFNLATFAISAVGTTSGTGTLLTGTNATPLPSNDTWSFNVSYNGGTQVIAAGTYSVNLSLSGTGAKTLNGNLIIGNDFNFGLAANTNTFVQNSGTTAYSITVGNDFLMTKGDYDMNSGTGASAIKIAGNFSNTGANLQTSTTSGVNGIITMAGPSTVASPQTFTNTNTANITWINFVVPSGAALQLNSDMPLELESSTNYQGSLTVQSGGTLNMQGFSVVPTNNDATSGTTTTNFTISAGATLMLSKTTGIPGAIPAATVTETFSSLANYEFDGTSASVTGTFTTTPTALTVNNLTINSTNTVTASQAFSVTGTLAITGTFNMGTNLLSAVGTPSGTGTLTTQNTTTAPIPSGKTWTGPVTFNGAGAQSIPAGTYVALTVSPSGTTTNVAQGNIAQSGTFTIGTNATLSMGTNQLTAVGTQAGAGFLTTQNTSTTPLPSGVTWTWPVTFNNSTTAQNIPGGTYAALTVSAPAVNVAQGDISQSGTFTIGSTATLSMGTNRLITLGTQSGTGALTTQNTASATPIPAGVTWTWPVTYNAASGNQTVVTGTYNTLNLSANATKTFAAGTVNVSGAWNSAGGNVDMTTNAATVAFTSASAQSITDAGSNSGAGVTFYNLNLSGAGTKTLVTGPFALASAGVLTITGAVTTFAAGNNLFSLKSDANSSATVAAITSGSTITGNVNVQRFFSGGPVATQRAYRLISFPVNTQGLTNNSGSTTSYNFASVSTYLYTGGPSGTGSGFTVANPGASTVFLYRENTPPLNGTFNGGTYRGIANLGVSSFQIVNQGSTYSLWSGGGAMVFYVGSRTSGTTFNTKSGGVFPDPDNTVMVSTGTLNQGIQPVKLWYNALLTFTNTGPSPTGDDGYALVGNPYASTISWDTYGTTAGSGIYAQSGIVSTCYQYNYSSKNWGAYTALDADGIGTNNATRYIASGQGFFVRTTATGGKLTFNEIAKTNAQPNSLGASYFLMGMPAASNKQQLLRIKASQDAINTDDIIIVFEPNSTNEYDEGRDADDIGGINSLISLSSYGTNSGRKLAINRMGNITPTTRIKLFVSGTTAVTDTLTARGIESLDTRYKVYLIDHYKNDSVLVTSAMRYPYSINPADTTTMGSTRFELVFHVNQTYAQYKLLSFTGKKVTTGVQLTWKVENEQNYVGFTIQRADGSQKIINFQSLHSLQSDGNGTYTYIDIAPLKTTGKYRLMQNDAFENITYSDIVSIDAGATNTPNLPVITLYPNPTVNNIQLALNVGYTGNLIHLVISNSNGRILINKDISVNNMIQNVSNLLPGTYVVELSDPSTKKVIGNKKFIKL